MTVDGCSPEEGLDMAICIYDNPATMARECWQDGRLLCKYDALLFLRKLAPWETQPVPAEQFFFGANIGDWKTGQLVGDIAAMSNAEITSGQKPSGLIDEP
jgi:hypothetical protein